MMKSKIKGFVADRRYKFLSEQMLQDSSSENILWLRVKGIKTIVDEKPQRRSIGIKYIMHYV